MQHAQDSSSFTRTMSSTPTARNGACEQFRLRLGPEFRLREFRLRLGLRLGLWLGLRLGLQHDACIY